jgi:hypothetical protein
LFRSKTASTKGDNILQVYGYLASISSGPCGKCIFFNFVCCNALSALNVDLMLRGRCAGAFGGVAENDGWLEKS